MGRVVVVGWATESGVGRELCDAVTNLSIVGAFVLTHASKRNRFDLIPEAIRHVSHGRDPRSEMESFIENVRPDTVLTWEGAPRTEFVDVWKRAGLRWVNVVHWDWFPGVRALRGAQLVAPNEMCRAGLSNSYGLPSDLLEVPVDTKRFPFRRRLKANQFGMAYGAGGPHGRRCLVETLSAWRLMGDAPPLRVIAQGKTPEFSEAPGVELLTENFWNPAEVYSTLDVAVQPSRFEGVGLSLLEAQACGLPVLTLDAEPMRTVAPDLLVRATRSTVENMPDHPIDAWTPAPEALAKAVEGLRDVDIADLSERARARAERSSWNALREAWSVFLGVTPVPVR